MAYDDMVPGAEANSKIIEIMLRDETTGQAKTGVAYGSVTYSYVREADNANRATGTCVNAALDVYTDHGWKETNIAGIYQFGVPQAALAAGKNAVTIKISASGAIDVKMRILIFGSDLRTVLPNAPAGGKGGLPLLDLSTGLVLSGFEDSPVNVKLGDNMAHGGAGATLALQSVVVNNPNGPGFVVQGSDSAVYINSDDGVGMSIFGDAVGLGISGGGGSDQPAVMISGPATGGDGVLIEATDGNAVTLTGGGENGKGIACNEISALLAAILASKVTVAPVAFAGTAATYTFAGAANLAFDVPQNAGTTIVGQVLDAAGDAVDLTTATLVFRVVDSAGTEILKLTEGDGIDTTDAEDGQVTITISAEDAAASGSYKYEFWDAAAPRLLAKGAFVIRATFGPGTENV